MVVSPGILGLLSLQALLDLKSYRSVREGMSQGFGLSSISYTPHTLSIPKPYLRHGKTKGVRRKAKGRRQEAKTCKAVQEKRRLREGEELSLHLC